MGRIEFQIGSQARAIRRLVERKIMITLAGPRNDADLRQPASALFEHDVVFKQLEIAEVDIIPMRNDFVPIVPLRLSYGRPHEPKVLRIIVGTDDKSVLDMVDVILVLPFTSNSNLKFAVRIVGV